MSTRDAKVYRFTTMTFIFVAAAAWAMLQSFWSSDYRWICLLIAAGASQAMLLDRKIQHDRLCEPVMVPVMPKQPEKTREQVYIPRIQSENGHRIRLGKFKKTRKEWSDLARVLKANENRFIRDVVAQAKAFNSISTNWPTIVAEFERMDWVKNGVLTEQGQEWFAQFLSPLPH
jgi:hypothetical protein